MSDATNGASSGGGPWGFWAIVSGKIDKTTRAARAWFIVKSERSVRSGTQFEFFLATMIAVSICHVAWRFFLQGYLPQPFYYDVGASLMDLYSTAFWAHHAGAYTIWHSLYPPLSFDLLRLFTTPSCYVVDQWEGRNCDELARGALVALFLVNAVLVWLSYRRADPTTALPRMAAVALGLPMLYALERGNLLIPCFTAFVLGAGPLIRSPLGRSIALAVSVNVKPYLLAVILPAIARRDWHWLISFGCAGLAVYAGTYLLEGTGNPVQLLSDMGGYAAGKKDLLWANLYFATSYWPLARFLAAREAFASSLRPEVIAAALWTIVAMMRAVQVGAAACMVSAILRPGNVEPRRFMALFAALIFTTVTNGSSGYAQFFLYFLVFFEPWRGPVRITMLVCAYLLCIPIDLAFWPMVSGTAFSFLAGRSVNVEFGVSVGQILRPGLLLIIQIGLIFLNLSDSWRVAAPTSVAGARPTL